MEKVNLTIAMQVLQEVHAKYPETKGFITGKLQQKWIFMASYGIKKGFEVTSLKAKSTTKIFYYRVKGYEVRTCFID